MKMVKNILATLLFLSISATVISSCDSPDSDLQPTIELNENTDRIGTDEDDGDDDGDQLPSGLN